VPGVVGIIVAGGAGRRMGGVDKAALTVGGITLLDRVLGAARRVCDRLVVVGPVRPTGVAGVRFVTELEPGGGPGAAVAAGLAAAPRAGAVLVLAADLPLLTAGHLRSLLSALDASGAGAAAAADEGGPNPLLAAYAGPQLAVRAAALRAGARAGALLPPDVVAVDLGRATLNVNCPEDLAEAERLAAAPGDGE
jgi:molybdopterin-guanine dinucleotide biosynthesis protein A